MSYEVAFKEVQGYSIGFGHGEDPANAVCVVINGIDTAYVEKDDEEVAGEIERFLKEVDRLTNAGEAIVLTEYGFDVVERKMGLLEDEDAFGELTKYRGATLKIGDVFVTDDWVKFDAFYLMLDSLGIEYTLKQVNSDDDGENGGESDGV